MHGGHGPGGDEEGVQGDGEPVVDDQARLAGERLAPVTQVPTGKVKDHQVIEKRMPARRARTTCAAARASHISAKPVTGTPYSTAKTAKPSAYGPGTTPGATSANFPTAVVDCPSGPRTRNSDGVSASGSGPPVSSLPKTTGSVTSVANRLMPNMATQASSSVSRGCPAGRCGTSSGPTAADTIGATSGSSHTGLACPGSTRWRTAIRYGTATAAASPITVPAVNSTVSRATAAGVPIQSRPRARAPPPTASRAIDRQP